MILHNPERLIETVISLRNGTTWDSVVPCGLNDFDIPAYIDVRVGTGDLVRVVLTGKRIWNRYVYVEGGVQ